jgi:C1A family cysteine protease
MHKAVVRSVFNLKATFFIILFIFNTLNSISYGIVDGVEITGEKIITLPSNSKEITIQTVKVTQEFKDKFKQKLQKIQIDNFNNNLAITTSTNLQSKVIKNFDIDLGMNNVPVLDQGAYGTCVTFSTTAALNAYKHAGDYISQQCLLEIGNYEEVISNYEISSGWDGAFFEEILNRINKYGVVDKKSCPRQYANRYYKMTPREYSSYSFNAQWAHDFQWKSINSFNKEGNEESASIEQVKKILNKGHRVLIGSLLIIKYIDGLPVNGKDHGLWDFPENYTIKQFLQDINNDGMGGHAMIVTGYNDKQRVLKIRNSWGKQAGDNGEFYMSYDFFEAMNIDAIELY